MYFQPHSLKAQCPQVTLELAVHVDHAAYNNYGGNTAQIVQDVETLIGNVETWFDDRLPVDFQIVIVGNEPGTPIVWETPDPFKEGTNPLRSSLNGDWNMHRPCVSKDGILLITGANWYGGGGSTGHVCDDPNDYVNIAWIDRFGDLPLAAMEFKLAHEIGHLLGATEMENTSCGTLCDDPNFDPLMCSNGVGAGVFNNATLECSLDQMISQFDNNCDCFGVPGGVTGGCNICFETGMIKADNTQPVPGCEGRDVINYTVTVCNSCDPQELTVQTSFDPTKVDILSHSFQSIEYLNPLSKMLTSTLNFDGQECKEFTYSARVKTGFSNVIGSKVFINGASLLTQSASSIGITPIGEMIGQMGIPTSLNALILNTTMLTETLSCNSGTSKRKFQISGILEIDVPYCLNGYDLVMMPGAEIVIKTGNTLEINNNTQIFGCDQLWKGITVEPGATLVIDGVTIEDAAYAVHLEGAQNTSITNSTFNNNLVGIYVDGANPGQSQKIIFDAFSGNTFSGTGTLFPPAAGLSHGPALTFGGKPFAGVWIENNLGSVLHSMGNSFAGLSNGIYTRRTSLKVTGDSYSNIQENGYAAGISGYGIRAESGKTAGASVLRTFQQSGFGKQPTDPYSFLDCSKAIKVTGMAVDYIRDNAIRAGKGIEVNVPPRKAFIESNLVQVGGSIGIELNQPSPATEVKLELNDIEVGPTATDGTGIQLNTMGLDPQGAGYVSIKNNNISLQADGARGLEMNASNSATVKQNYVTLTDGAANSRAFQVNSDFNSLLTCNNSAGSDMAGNTTGFDISDAESTDYSCNSTTDMGTGVYFQMGSFSPEAFQETSFSGGSVGLKISVSAAIGTQTQKGNKWTGSFGSFGANNLGNSLGSFQNSQFTVHEGPGSAYTPTVPSGQQIWFDIDDTGTPDSDCDYIACAQSGPTPPGNEEKFGFDASVADYSFTIGDHPAEIGWLAKRYLYRKLTRNPVLITPGSEYENFYNNEAPSSIGGLLSINLGTAAIYDVDQSTAAQLDSGFGNITASMEAISVIDSQLVSQGYDSILVQQRLLEVQGIESIESDMDSIMSLLLTQREVDAGNIASQNANIVDSFILEANEKAVNGIFLKTVAQETFEFDGTQMTTLQNIASQCPLTGGSAVYEARSLLSIVQDDIYDDGVLCSGAQARARNARINSEVQSGFRLFPNPAKEKVTLLVPEGISKVKVLLVNAQGAIVLELKLSVKSRSAVIHTGQIAEGIYLLNIFDSNKKVSTERLVIIH